MSFVLFVNLKKEYSVWLITRTPLHKLTAHVVVPVFLDAANKLPCKADMSWALAAKDFSSLL